MSLKIMSQVWDDPGIETPVEVAVMLALADFANDKGECFPGLVTICTKSRCCRGAVYYTIQRMVQKGKLSYRKGGGARKSNHYQFHLGTVHPMNRSPDEPLSSNRSPDERVTVHHMNKNGSPGEPDPSGTPNLTPKGEGKASPSSKNKDGSEVYLLNQALEIAPPAAKKELLKQKRTVLGKHFGVDLNNKPPANVIPLEPVAPPAPMELVKKLADEARAAIDSEPPVIQPNRKALREQRYKRPPAP